MEEAVGLLEKSFVLGFLVVLDFLLLCFLVLGFLGKLGEVLCLKALAS